MNSEPNRKSTSKISKLSPETRKALAGALAEGKTYDQALAEAGVTGISHQNLSKWWRKVLDSTTASLKALNMFDPSPPPPREPEEAAQEASALATEAIAAARQTLSSLRQNNDPASTRNFLALLYTIPGLVGALVAAQKLNQHLHTSRSLHKVSESARQKFCGNTGLDIAAAIPLEPDSEPQPLAAPKRSGGG